MDIQEGNLQKQFLVKDGKGKGKEKASNLGEEDDVEDEGFEGISMNVDGTDDSDQEEAPLRPMPKPEGIATLRKKLHARMQELRQKGRNRGANEEPGSRDELLEERRRQRGAMREKRRKETREKIRKVEESKNKKNKEIDRNAGHQSKVRI